MKYMNIGFMMLMALAFGSVSYAGSDLTKGCGPEIQKFCKGADTDEKAFECLEGREHMGKKSGLSKKCYDAHEAYEAKSGKHEEKNEKHEAEENKS